MANNSEMHAFNTLMDSKTKSIFGKDYLDTANHECKHIRDMFKDWDKHTYSEDVFNNADIIGNRKYIQQHVESYERNLKKHISKKFVSR